LTAVQLESFCTKLLDSLMVRYNFTVSSKMIMDAQNGPMITAITTKVIIMHAIVEHVTFVLNFHVVVP